MANYYMQPLVRINGINHAVRPSAVLSLLLLCIALLVVTTLSPAAEAAKIEIFNPASCDGAPTNTFVDGNTCQKFNDQGAFRISDVSAGTRVSVHNQQNCEGSSSAVAQIYGPGCVVQGATKLRAVWIQG